MTARQLAAAAILTLVTTLAVPALAAAGGPGESCAAPLDIASLPFNETNLDGSQHNDDRDATGFSCSATANGVDRVYEITLGPSQTATCTVQYTVPVPVHQPDGTSTPVTAVISDGCGGSTETFCEETFSPSAITFPGAGTYYIWLDWDPLHFANIDCTGALPVELVEFDIE